MEIQWSLWREGGSQPLLASCGSRPVGALRSLASVHIQGLQAVLTTHRTAPVELTLTLGHPCDAGGVVASTAAHDFAAVHASGGQVAHTASCTQGAWKTSRAVSLKRCGRKATYLEEKSYKVILQNRALTPTHHSLGLYRQFWGQPQGRWCCLEGQVQEGWT